MRTHKLVFVATVAFVVTTAPLAAQKKSRPTAPAKKPLTLEAIFSDTGLTGRMPTQMRWSPDGRLLTYILQADNGERRDLWAVDAETGEKKVLVSYEQLTKLAPPPEKATADERERERLLRYSVAAYIWSPDSKAILFTSAGQLYLFDLAGQSARALAPAKRGVGDPKFSPDGHWVSFLYEHDLWLVPVSGGEEKRLTTGGSELVLHGDLDWVYPEEFDVRSGYFWSRDSRRIAFLELDQTQVPTYPIVDLVPRSAPVDFQRYPKAGDPNPRPRVGVVEISAVERGGATPSEVTWLDRAAEYIPRFQWMDANRLAVQLLNRAQTELEVVLADAATGRSRTLLAESDPNWINVTNDLTFLESGDFLWTSERTGYRHIYLHGADGAEKRALTGGEWEVQGIEGVEEIAGWAYYTATTDNPLGSNLYRVKHDGSDRERLTDGRGTHAITLNSRASAYADTGSALGRVPEIGIRLLGAGRTTTFHRAQPLDEYEMVAPQLEEIPASDGALVRTMLFKPRVFDTKKKFPVVMYVYGGPHAPTIRDAWGGNRYLYHQYLVQQGFVVLYVDDRASSRPGHKHEAALRRAYGPTALEDYRVAVEWLRKQPWADSERIAIWGWSGGGFSTCFALTHSDLFKVGIAVAPVTDWHLYDSIYTERYMGLPQQEVDAYKATSCVGAAGNLHGQLLLVHGTADDNVHIQNTEQLIQALIEAAQPYDLLVYPQKTHSIRGAKAQLHLHRAMAEYLKKNL
jgi:dipeptidyl-peptidase-4